MRRKLHLRAGEAGVRAASSLLRMLCGLLDMVIPVGLTAVVCVIASYPDVASMPLRYWNYLDYFVDVFNTQPSLILFPAVVFCGMYLVTGTLFTVIIGNTPVSRLFGIRVCSMTGRPIGLFRAFLWTFAGMIFAAAAFAGPLWTIVDPKRRMLHDILARVVVVSGQVYCETGDDDHGALITSCPDLSGSGLKDSDAVAPPWHEQGGNW